VATGDRRDGPGSLRRTGAPGAGRVFYGQNPRHLDAVARACPIVGSYPEKDFTAGQARKLEVTLESHDVPHYVKLHPGVRHSFFNPRQRAHHPSAAEDSWRRTLVFYEQHLGGKS